jgi:hypothetical protein
MTVIAVVLPAAAFAQAGSSTIAGVVRDATGGALPGASVTVVNLATGVAVEAVTNEEGVYRASALIPGEYRVETMLDGFAMVVRGPITLEVSQTLADSFASVPVSRCSVAVKAVAD